MNYAQGIYYWVWFIKAAINEAERMNRPYCKVFPINPQQ